MASKPGRKNTSWKTSELRVIKQLCGVVMRLEAVGKYELRKRIEELLPEISQHVLGVIWTYREAQEKTIREQGKERQMTPNRLWGRGDVVNREGYKEVDQYTPLVVQAYLDITQTHIEVDPCRNFSDEDVRFFVNRQRKRCYNPACKAPFTGINPPVGAHANIPWSLGGRTNRDNGVALCWRCNSAQGDMPLAEFIAKCAMNNAGARRKLGKECEGEDAHT